MKRNYLHESEWVSLGDDNSSQRLTFCKSVAEADNNENKGCSLGFKSTSEINSESKYWRNSFVFLSWYEFNWKSTSTFSSNELSIIIFNNFLNENLEKILHYYEKVY